MIYYTTLLFNIMARYAKQPGLQRLMKNDTSQLFTPAKVITKSIVSVSRVEAKPLVNPRRIVLRLPTSQDSRWSKIQASEKKDVLEQLTKHCHSSSDLERNHYRIKPFTEEEIDLRRKCLSCGGTSAQSLQSMLLLIFQQSKEKTSGRCEWCLLLSSPEEKGLLCCSLIHILHTDGFVIDKI